MPMQIGVRQFDALMRLCEASARMRLSSEATEDDARLAIESLDECLRKFAYVPPSGQLDMYDNPAPRIGKNATKKDTERKLMTELVEIIEREIENGKPHVAFMDIYNGMRRSLEPATNSISTTRVAAIIEKCQQEGLIIQAGSLRAWKKL